eukprot:CAMPEP_0113850418 /NCGR_PEP_ID=MMETSP0372-20130328/3861_1 /TAXON_ID=340204 /ORGANISM="Lankesteria abbotti" /LENGTH=89 /DNA_ID=CAMNT_0000820689 /DNA_START=102 /DNA_END=371 /DNA_ORIENTATION=+ /assembly_acc=CAM_ASM_000359
MVFWLLPGMASLLAVSHHVANREFSTIAKDERPIGLGFGWGCGLGFVCGVWVGCTFHSAVRRLFALGGMLLDVFVGGSVDEDDEKRVHK